MTDKLKDAFLSKEVLVDIETIKIDTTLSKEERIQSYIQQIKNPYWCKCKQLLKELILIVAVRPLRIFLHIPYFA